LTAPLSVTAGNVTFANDRRIALIAGPCQLESRAHALEMASALVEITGRLGMPLVYKTSFDKANRTSRSSPKSATPSAFRC
jgi:2-dehydro-3-deoxyphosphooctonate aldolase (KDO 8-P synthase)